MLKAQDLVCIRNNQLLFAKLNFSLRSGEILHVLGSNGSGKSSLLQMLIGALSPQEGAIYWQDRVISDPEVAYCQKVLYLGHKIGVKNTLTVQENLQLMAQLGGVASILDWGHILQQFGLQAMGQVLCGKLSAGQRQRVALTRLALVPAKVWILDEPFTAIDQQTAQILERLLIQFVAGGGIVILTSHQSLSLPSERVQRLQLDVFSVQDNSAATML